MRAPWLSAVLLALAAVATLSGPADARSHHRHAYAASPAANSSDYYTNVSGHQVHRPMHARSVPSGASARCGDGTYSFSEHARGTCSHHGGVSSWLH